jgi:hypothetical protein
MTKKVVEETVAEQATEVMTWEDAIKAKALEQARQRGQMHTGPKFLSFKAGQLMVDKVAIPGNRLDVVVLTYIGENTYYKGKYDPTTTQTPVCYAIYNKAEDMWPSDAVKEKQSDACHDCPKFQWGSDPMGGRGKACKTRYRIAIIPAPDQGASEDHVMGAELRFATIPVTSVKNFEQFMSKAELLFSRPMFGVVAALTVIPDAKSQYLVQLDAIEAVHGPLLLPILKRIEEAEKAITYDLGFEEAEEAPAKPLK